MNISKIQFQEKASQRVYWNYMNRIEKALKILPKQEQKDVLMEFNSHIFEGMKRNSSKNEMDCLLDIIEKLGDPDEVLKPMIAEKKLVQATKTFNPIHVFKALTLNITNGLSYIVFSILYLLLFSFIALIIMKIIYPENVGMFIENGKLRTLGMSFPRPENTKEVLGNMFIPFVILGTIISYLFITLLMKLKQFINKK
jgi:uncharacterized membrane protein